ncbi:uncharacterized protein LOC117880275 [Trachemys scripta elegans]|uniref:uncharacterized protein LOC117880275 n=1 Tax=Trachemys scripta elegans TaxID=31138 RepID=UPI001555B121|nr:uncharacterized protein LOC117880275 [Trachemys scripta elegans]
MDSFTTPVRTLDFVLAPSTFELVWRKCYISDSSEKEEGATELSPLAQPLMDTPEPDPETLVRHPYERDGLSLSTPSEVEGDCSSGESPADKANGKDSTQLDDAFLEDPEALDSVASSREDEPSPPCFCSTPIQIVEEDSEDDGYEEFRRQLGIEIVERLLRGNMDSFIIPVRTSDWLGIEIMERLLRGNMDSFTTPVRTSVFVLAPRVFDHPRIKCYISDSSEEEEGATEGSLLAQPLMDTPEPDPETLVRHPDERDGLSLSTPLRGGR